MALQSLYESFYASPERAPLRALQHGMESANLRVFQTAEKLGVGRMGTTLTAVGIRGRQLYLAHVGDSRAYLVRGGRVTSLTHDHTAVGDLVRMKVISPDRVRTHAQRSILNRAVGLTLFVQPDLVNMALHEGDRLILCSDGLWAAVEDEDFARLAGQASSASDLSRALVERALENGSDDNVSTVSVFVHSLADEPARAEKSKRGLIDSLRGLLTSKHNGTSA
jgi:protein phosphatase